MNKLLIPQDKANHFIYGFVVFLAMLFLSSSVEWALAVSIAVGILKEAVDATLNMLAFRKGLPPPHGVEAMDAVATALGGAAGALAIFIHGLST
jgi:hypothetical protein